MDFVEENKNGLISPLTSEGRRKKVLIPGCGRGYEVVMLALHGFDAYGLDISETAISEAKKYSSEELQNPHDYNFGPNNPSQTIASTVGNVSFFNQNFFEKGWEKDMKFDIIYDYTFLCALHPSMRSQWAEKMSELLNKEGGILVCLEFPMYKELSVPGPPWGLNGVHWDLLELGNDGVLHTRTQSNTEENGKFKRIEYFMPDRTYEQGQGTDMLSVYRLK